jgi:adenosylhomocysteine nucleosidase
MSCSHEFDSMQRMPADNRRSAAAAAPDTSTPRIVILSAISVEARAIARSLGLKPAGGVRSTPDRWTNETDSISVTPIGIRAGGLGRVATASCRCIILAGYAGALDPSLRVGDVVLDDCPPMWRKGFDGREGKICSSPHIITTGRQKAELFSETGALAVDMESNTVRTWAAAAGLAFVSIRAISDAADQDLNPAILRFIDEYGGIKPFALAGGLLRKPMMLPQLLRLGAASKLAGKNLGRAVSWLVERMRESDASHS